MNTYSPASTFLIWSNYNINFILSSIKLLALIYYITNYTTKDNCSWYQRVIATTIVSKVFNDYDNNLMTDPSNYTSLLDKFSLKAFNWLSHDWEISRPLVISYLLNLPNHYSLKVIMTTINIALL